MTQIKLRRDTAANFTSANPVLGVGEPAYETDTKKLKIGDGTTAYNSLAYFTMTDEFAAYRKKYGAPDDSVPVVNAGNSITIKAGVSIETPNGTLTNATDMTYTYDFLTDRVLFVTENDYYHAYAVYYGGREPSPVGEQIFWFNNNVWTMISGNGTKTVFNTQKITPIAKIYQVDGTVKNIDYSSYTKTSAGGGGSTNISATLPLKIVDGVISLEVDGQTIQIVDGKLHANLDDKQDKFETQVPLSISSSSITTSVPTGITETTESWSGGGSDKLITVDVSALNVDANSDWKIHLSGYMGNYKSTDTNTNVLLIAAEKKTIFRVWFGSWDFRLGNSTTKFKRIPNEGREFFYEIVHQKNGTEFTFNGTDLVDSSPLPISTMASALGSETYTTLAGQGKLKDFTFLINSYQFQRIDRDISKSYFEADGVKYRFTSVEGTNTLQLNIGSGLSVVDGKLTASSTAPTNMVTTDTTQTISGRKTFGDKIIFNRPDDGAAEPSSILGGEFKLGTSNYDNSIYANQLLLNANTTNAGTFKVQTSSTRFTQINGATITSQRTDTGAYKIINTIRPSGASSNKNYSVLYSEVDGSYNHKLTINNLSSDLVLAGKTVKDGSGNEFLTSGNVVAYVTEEFVNGTEGYRIWSNGRCEQWGQKTSIEGIQTITFLKTYANTNFTLLANMINSPSTAYKIQGKGATTSSASFVVSDNAYYIAGVLYCWYVSGELAS